MFEYFTLNELLGQIKKITKCEVYDIEVHNRYWLITIFRPEAKDPEATMRIKALIPFNK